MNKDILYRYVQGLCSAEELELILDKLENDSDWKAEYVLLKNLYSSASAYEYPSNKTVDQAFRELDQSINKSPFKKKEFPITRRAWMAIAASFVIGIFTILLLRDTEAPVHYTHSGDQHGVMELPDGSVVALGSDAKIGFKKSNFDAGNRTVYLSGDAYFNVYPGNGDFVVKSENISTTVTGTKFSVSNTDVKVYEGSVEVEAYDQIVAVTKGYVAVLNDKLLEKKKMETSSSLPGWVESNMQFNEQKLSVILDYVGRYYNISISCHASIADSRYTINLSGLDQKTALETLATVTNTVLQKSENSYQLML